MKTENTRNEILSVAANLFSNLGYHNTTIDDIALNAHKAKGSVYYYFRSKEELFHNLN